MKTLNLLSYTLLSRKNVKRLLIVHAKQSWFESVRSGKFDFFQKIEKSLLQHNISCRVVRANSLLSRRLRGKKHIHLLIGELPDTSDRGLHVMPSYIWGFWYLDSSGVHWKSSIGALDFQPSSIMQSSADYFFNGVSGHMLRENVSKFPQSKRSATALERADAVIFLQEIEKFEEQVHFLDSKAMITVAANYFEDGRVYVKPHPAMSHKALADIVRLCSRYKNTTVSDASVHDLVAASSVVLTQNSAVGFEALMQKKPVITCAKSDYWHATCVATSEVDLTEKLGVAKSALRDFPYEKYLYWFLHEHCFEPQSEDFEEMVFEKLRTTWPEFF